MVVSGLAAAPAPHAVARSERADLMAAPFDLVKGRRLRAVACEQERGKGQRNRQDRQCNRCHVCQGLIFLSAIFARVSFLFFGNSG
jgi:hypothetical protein